MTYNIVKRVGDPKTATTHARQKVTRQEALFVEEWGAMVRCAPYDNHFIYHNNAPEQSSYMCTCGSPAVVVPPGPDGMFVCLFDAQYGNHKTTYVNLKDEQAGKYAGKTIEIAGKRAKVREN